MSIDVTDVSLTMTLVVGVVDIVECQSPARARRAGSGLGSGLKPKIRLQLSFEKA